MKSPWGSDGMAASPTLHANAGHRPSRTLFEKPGAPEPSLLALPPMISLAPLLKSEGLPWMARASGYYLQTLANELGLWPSLLYLGSAKLPSDGLRVPNPKGCALR
jgi:hypothetical protein